MAYKRKLTIGGIDFSTKADGIDFSWNWRGGCDTASIKISAGVFDETFGIDIEDDVRIQYSTGVNWWRGVVVDLHTDLSGGLTVQCAGTKIYMDEVIPGGRFGQFVETTRPTDIETTAAAAGANAPGLTQTQHIFVVTAIDDEGETFGGTAKAGETSGTSPGASIPFVSETIAAAAKQITVAWVASTQGATGYKVYVNLNATGTPDATYTSAGGMVVFDVVGTSFVLDGSVAGEPANFPFAGPAFETSITPTIAATEITDCVGYLLDTYLPSQLTKGTVSLTTDPTLKNYDLKDNNDSLQRVLDALVLLTGDAAHWYVDQNNTVHFRDKLATVLSTFILKKAAGDITGETNLLTGLAKRKTRDGVTNVKVQGEPEFEEGVDNCNIGNEGITWDDATQPTSVDAEYIALTKDPRVFSDAPPRNPTVDLPNFSSGAAARLWITDNYATLQLWLDVFPNYRWLWIMANDQAVADHNIGSLVNAIGLRQWQSTAASLAGSTTFGARPKLHVIRVAGVKSIADAGVAGYTWLARRSPNPETWSAQVDQIDTLFIPGRGKFKVVTEFGNVYTLDIRQIKYVFDNSVEASCDLGDEEVEVDRESKRTYEYMLINQALRKTNRNSWAAYNG